MARDDQQVTALRATAHPLRLRMLSLLTASSMSAAELARELDTTQANASYHLRVLADAGEVVADGEEVVRGGVAKKYRHPWRQAAGNQRVDDEGAGHVQAMTAELLRRWRDHTPGGRGYFCDAELWVDPEVWAEVFSLVEHAGTLIHDRALPPHSPGALRVNLQSVAFTMQDDA